MSMRGRGSPEPTEPLFPVRTVVEDKLFDEQREIIAPSVHRLDEILFGVIWAVARGPERFPQVLDKPALYVIKTGKFPDIPSLRIFFTFDDNEVHLKWIEVFEEDEEEQGE